MTPEAVEIGLAMNPADSNEPPVILVVEDEPLLRMLAVDVVEEAGFVAVAAQDADEAVVLLESRTDIAVLFTDINMPGSMNGLTLAHTVRDRWPPIKILVASGQLQQIDPCFLPQHSIFLRKPYQASALILELRSMMAPWGRA